MPLLQNVGRAIRDWLARRFPRLFRRKPPQPGRFVSDSKLSWRGFLRTAPWHLPQREYLVYVPDGADARFNFRRHALLVLIHGCRQTPEDIATGTRITALADRERFLVLLPRQHSRANSWGCWNWFDGATVSGAGETAIVAAQIRAARKRFRIDKKRVFVAGMSAGGALAAVLGLRRPDLVAGVFVHSGIACGAAASPYHAMDVLNKGPDNDVVRIALKAREESDGHSLPVPLYAVQGERDEIVNPVNSVELVRQYLAFNGHPAAAQSAPGALPPADRHVVTSTSDARIVTTSEWLLDGRKIATHVCVQGLGHAWAGGDPQFAFHDANAPDATLLLAAFMSDTVQ